MTPPAPGPSRAAALSAEIFRQLQAAARRNVAARKWTAEQATGRLRPWLAIAAAAGADLPELRDEGVRIFPWAEAGRPVSLRLFAEDICPRAEWQAALARARDDAVARAGCDETIARARDLLALSRALGVGTPINPPARPGEGPEPAEGPVSKEQPQEQAA